MSEFKKTNGVLVALSTVQKQIVDKFGFDVCPFVTTDDWMSAVKKARLKKHQETSDKTVTGDIILYPCAFIRMNTFGIAEDAHNVPNIVAAGSGYTYTSDLTTASAVKHYKLWATVELTLNAKFLDFEEYVNFGEYLSILIKAKRLNTEIFVGDTDKWTVSVTGSSIINHADALMDANEGPGVFTLTHPLTVKTQFGGYKEVPKVNNEGRVTTSLSVGTQKVE
jgi:hypothetical protein